MQHAMTREHRMEFCLNLILTGIEHGNIRAKPIVAINPEATEMPMDDLADVIRDALRVDFDTTKSPYDHITHDLPNTP